MAGELLFDVLRQCAAQRCETDGLLRAIALTLTAADAQQRIEADAGGAVVTLFHQRTGRTYRRANAVVLALIVLDGYGR